VASARATASEQRDDDRWNAIPSMRPGPATTSAPDRLARKSEGCPSGSPTDGSAGSPTPRTRRARVARCSPRGVHRGDTLAIVATHRVCASRRRPPTVSERTPHEEGRADGPSARTAPGWPSAQPSNPRWQHRGHRKRDRPAPPHLRMVRRSDNGTERVWRDDRSCNGVQRRPKATSEGNRPREDRPSSTFNSARWYGPLRGAKPRGTACCRYDCESASGNGCAGGIADRQVAKSEEATSAVTRCGCEEGESSGGYETSMRGTSGSTCPAAHDASDGEVRGAGST
jgi:hypothetical protein